MVIPDEKIFGEFRSAWLKLDETSSDKHQLFFKEHSVRNQEPEYPKGRTLFVLNIPPYVTVSCLNAAFAKNCGPVTMSKILPSLSTTKKGFKVAYVVFAGDSGLDKALSLSRDFTFILNSGKRKCHLGIRKWCREYNESVKKTEIQLKAEIEKYMAEFDKRAEEKAAVKNEEMETDGWVTVSSKKKRGQFAPARKESTMNKLQAMKEQKNKKKELVNFYAFQKREANKERLAELRKKFELDKKKLQDLKTKRTFKPFG